MMNRRQALLAAIALVGGAATTLPAWAYEGTVGATGRFFSRPEMALLAAVAEIMIPATDTPGAAAANVHGVVDGLMVDWAALETQGQFRAILAGIDARGPRPFLTLAPAERAALLTGIDIAAFKGQRPEDQGWRRLKQLIWYAYFTSQGADPDYVAVPGDYRGDLSRAEYRRLVEERR